MSLVLIDRDNVDLSLFFVPHTVLETDSGSPSLGVFIFLIGFIGILFLLVECFTNPSHRHEERLLVYEKNLEKWRKNKFNGKISMTYFTLHLKQKLKIPYGKIKVALELSLWLLIIYLAHSTLYHLSSRVAILDKETAIVYYLNDYLVRKPKVIKKDMLVDWNLNMDVVTPDKGMAPLPDPICFVVLNRKEPIKEGRFSYNSDIFNIKTSDCYKLNKRILLHEKQKELEAKKNK